MVAELVGAAVFITGAGFVWARRQRDRNTCANFGHIWSKPDYAVIAYPYRLRCQRCGKRVE